MFSLTDREGNSKVKLGRHEEDGGSLNSIHSNGMKGYEIGSNESRSVENFGGRGKKVRGDRKAKMNPIAARKSIGKLSRKSEGSEDNAEEAKKEEKSPAEKESREVEMKADRSEKEEMILNLQEAECKICNQTYSNQVNLKKHVYNVHKMIRVKCHVCDKEVNKKSLDRHMKSVHSARIPAKKKRKSIPEEEKIPCDVCNKKFPNVSNLRNHVRNIHEAEQFKCGQCDFRGIRRQLEKHVKREHSDQVYQCSRCQKILKSKSTLKEHMWIHTDHRRFICDVCGMRFKRTSNYHGHLKSHQEKKFQCQLCGNFFLRKRYLAVHEQTIHNYYGEGVPPQEKGYQCEVCGVKLKWKNNLLAHMRIHTGEKPYKCKICGEDFTCHGSLRTHMSKHAICSASSDASTVFIRQAYLENRTEPATYFGQPTTSALSSSLDSDPVKKV